MRPVKPKLREGSLQPGDEFSCVFDRLSFGGQVIGHAPDGRVLFSSGAAPGDRALVRVTEVKKRFAVGEIVEMEALGEAHRPQSCAYAKICGGCPWGCADHALQLQTLQSHLAHLLNHPCEINAVPPEMGWRSTGRLHWCDGQLGFYRVGGQSLFEVETCLAFSPELSCMLTELREKFLPFLQGKGTLRLTAAPGASSGTIAIECDDLETYRRLVSQAEQALGQSIHGVKIFVAGQNGCSASFGEPYDRLGSDGVKSPAGSFVQAHQPGNAALVEAVVHAALEAQKEVKDDKLLELFAGSGNFTFPLASAGFQVTAVEIDAAAVTSLQAEALARGLNVKAMVSDATQMRLTESKMLLLDPPRAGDACLESRLAEAFALKKVFYVSCHPATLARDAAILEKNGFQLSSLQLFDLFPQTGHVETFAVFSRGRKPVSRRFKA